MPESLHAWNKEWPRNRLGLAKWLVDPGNPLVARVTVNRWWGQLFGTGIVSTEADFGSQSEPPLIPASRLVGRRVHGEWLVDEAYSQAYRPQRNLRAEFPVSPSVLERDPRNLYFSRGPRLRMSAEMIRDNALLVSGLMSEKMGGPPSIRRSPTGFGVKPDATNRSMRCGQKRGSFPSRGHVIWRRAAPYASFVNFDGPDRSSCFPKRSRTNTPLQALTLLNDQAYVEMALGFAASILREKGLSATEMQSVWLSAGLFPGNQPRRRLLF